jgi:hypothetical protein
MASLPLEPQLNSGLQSEKRCLHPIRVVPHHLGNVDVFVDGTDFAAFNYPDRASLADGAGKSWCDSAPRRLLIFLPALRVREISTGEPLAVYPCAFSHPALE